MMDTVLPKDNDVNRSFIIVSEAIERMSVFPSERQIKMINKIAIMIAIEQSMDMIFSRYVGVWYNKDILKYEAAVYDGKGKKVCTIYANTDKECFEKLKSHKNEKR